MRATTKLLIVMILFFSLFACERREPKRFELTYHHNYNWADSLILCEGIWAGDSVRANFLVDSLRRTGDLNKLGADVFHIMIHQAFKQVSDIDFDVERMSRHAITHNSPEEQQQWYYDYAVNSLAYQLYMTHNYEGFLHVALPIIASMESSGTAYYRYMTDILTMMACCYVKLDQPEKAKKVAAPTYKGFLGADYRQNKWTVTAGLQYLDHLYTAVGANEKSENVTLLNATINYALTKCTALWVRGENLLAQSYELNAGFPMPRATFMGGVNIQF